MPGITTKIPEKHYEEKSATVLIRHPSSPVLLFVTHTPAKKGK